MDDEDLPVKKRGTVSTFLFAAAAILALISIFEFTTGHTLPGKRSPMHAAKPGEPRNMLIVAAVVFGIGCIAKRIEKDQCKHAEPVTGTDARRGSLKR